MRRREAYGGCCLFCGGPSRAHRAAPRRDLRAGFFRARLPALRDELGRDDCERRPPSLRPAEYQFIAEAMFQ
eukprot:1288362-Lingulodinium_polyedra.AAC.1